MPQRPVILCVDDERMILNAIKEQLDRYFKKEYSIECAENADTALVIFKELREDNIEIPVVISDQIMPGIKGDAFLKMIHEMSPRTKNILLTGQADADAIGRAVNSSGLFRYISKPWDQTNLKSIVQQALNSYYFDKTLLDEILEFKTLNQGLQVYNKELLNQVENSILSAPKQVVDPNLKTYIRFWGTRGSSPVSGPEFTKFGGSTCCLELRDHDNIIIFDAGTGSRMLGEELVQSSVRDITLIVSHFHWDHISGFPFFLPIYNKDFKIKIYAPGDPESIKEQFSKMLSPEFFPVGLKDLQSTITFHSLDIEPELQIGNINIKMSRAHHPGATMCFKVTTPTLTFGYATDNEFLLGNYLDSNSIKVDSPLLEKYKDQIEFFKGCELMIHEAQYLLDSYRKKTGWGHSSIDNASVLMKIIHPKDWVITHHDPDESDQDLLLKEKLVQNLVQDICNVKMAEDGMIRGL